jgi:hypothetical protein
MKYQTETKQFLLLFLGVLGISLFFYFLRGFGVLTFIPGGMIHFLLLLSLITGIVYGIIQTKRY